MIKNCPMRHKNGNCLPAGGFCTANKTICGALYNAYEMGRYATYNNVISRQVAIDAIMGEYPEAHYPSWYADIIEKLPNAQPDLQPTCNQLATDCISRQAAVDTARKCSVKKVTSDFCDDAVMRGDAIDAMCTIVCGEERHHCDGLNGCENLKMFDELPPAQQERKWIPASERLPEESGLYVITAYDGVASRTTFAKYQKKLKSWELTGARAYWRVLAWMPLPEPEVKTYTRWRTFENREIKVPKRWALDKSSVRITENPYTGYPRREYRIVRLDNGKRRC